MVETSMPHSWCNPQTSTIGGSYSRICLITWRGSAPEAIAAVVGLAPGDVLKSEDISKARQIPCKISLQR
jgi:hypothetical protein